MLQEADPEAVRLQLLANPEVLAELRIPELAEAAVSDPARFAQLYHVLNEQRRNHEFERQRRIMQLNDDPFNADAQREIEEMIRQEAVLENLQQALEYNPEAFGRVTMLYVNLEVNGHSVKAFVDSGAQATIMTPECAERCGIMRLVDKRFSGIARGVGTAQIIGRVHSAPIKIGSSFLACSFTIMENHGVEMLFGLDMLRRHQAKIDLEKNVLCISGSDVPFLGEHELPEQARQFEQAVDPTAQTVPRPPPPSGAQPAAASGRFATPGHRLGGAPAAPAAPAAAVSEDKVQQLVGLGFDRLEAIQALEAADGDVDAAASFLM